MKRLVILGEGQGETSALPVLTRRVLQEKGAAHLLFVDNDIIRAGNASGLVKWDKEKNRLDCQKWSQRLGYAARRSNLGGVLAVFDGDASTFPAGSDSKFCAAKAARTMVKAAAEVGAGKIFSLAIVFACVEYETWIIAGAESLAGKILEDGRAALPAGIKFPSGDPESHGKSWLENNCQGYRPTRDQSVLTGLLDLNVVRSKKLRSFTRFERAVEQLVEANAKGTFVSTP